MCRRDPIPCVDRRLLKTFNYAAWTGRHAAYGRAGIGSFGSKQSGWSTLVARPTAPFSDESPARLVSFHAFMRQHLEA